MYAQLIADAGRIAEIAGVATILLGFVASGAMAIADLRRVQGRVAYRALRQRLGRAILLGLEMLVAADIIGTVTQDPNLTNVLVLGIIVLIRTFLSFTLEMEIEGSWPWQQRGTSDSNAPRG